MLHKNTGKFGKGVGEMTPRERMIKITEDTWADICVHGDGKILISEVMKQAILSAVPLIVEMARQEPETSYMTLADGREVEVCGDETYTYKDAESIIAALKELEK